MNTQQQMRAWIELEQEILWSDLDRALRYAINGVWSMAASNHCARIISAARLVGPTPYGKVPWSLLAGDIYETLYEIGDIVVSLPTRAQWEEIELRMIFLPMRASLRARFAETRAKMRSEPSRMLILQRRGL